MKKYTPGPYPGRVTLFRAAKQPAQYSLDPTLGWSGVTAGVDVHEVPGHHGALVEEPQLSILVELLRARLDAIAPPSDTASAEDPVPSGAA